MEYFFTSPHLVTPPSLSITGEEFRHLHKVIRRKVGDTVFVVDGEGNLYETVIEKVDRKQAIRSIVQRSKPSTKPHIEVTLAAALLKNPSERNIELTYTRFATPVRKFRIVRAASLAVRLSTSYFGLSSTMSII